MSIPQVNILIPTFNEADHIAEAVVNARELGEVYVVDSFSTDGTQGIARSHGATVVEHPFVHFSQQKNWALDNMPFTAPWIFILDADERITPALRQEIQQRIKNTSHDGFFVNRLLIFMGQSVRHGGLYPSWNLRLFRRGKARYEDRSVHEHMICNGSTGSLRAEMLHIRRESISFYLEKHIRYADMESDEWVKRKLGRGGGADPSQLFQSTLRYRQWLRREVWPRIPCRPILRFLYMFVFQRGFLDGVAGWHLAQLMASYEYMISLMYWDKLMQHQQSQLAAHDVHHDDATTVNPQETHT